MADIYGISDSLQNTKQSQARENARVLVAIGFGLAFAFHWLKTCPDVCWPITEGSSAKAQVPFDALLKIALLGFRPKSFQLGKVLARKFCEARQTSATGSRVQMLGLEARFSKLPKLSGPFSGAIIPYLS